ncbi:hypothetical protein LCGC14_0781110, partial [marine sediment metagenome]
MASIKIVRRKNKQRKDGTAPLALRISKDYRTNYSFLGQYVLEKDWDEKLGKIKKTHPNSNRLNNFLMQKLTEANNLVFETNDGISSLQMKNKVKGKGHRKSFFEVAAERLQEKYDSEVFSVARAELSIIYNLEEFVNLKKSANRDTVIKEIKQRRLDRISRGRKSEHSISDSIKEFRNKKSLYFEDINSSFISRYKAFCIAYMGHKTRTITNQLIFIRTLFNIALKDSVVDIKHYPFADDKEKIRIGSGHKIGLTEKEVERIEKLEIAIEELKNSEEVLSSKKDIN